MSSRIGAMSKESTSMDVCFPPHSQSEFQTPDTVGPIPHDNSSVRPGTSHTTITAGQVSDPHVRERQQAGVASDRFQTFVADNMGTYAPIFVDQGVASCNGPNASPAIPNSSPATSFTEPQAEVYMGLRSTIEIEEQFSNLAAEDLAYLKTKGAFDLPSRELQQDMIEAYFTYVNPMLPVINRTWFLQEFHNHKTPSLLLLFAIFTAGCKACNNPALMDARGTKHESGRRFYKITKALLDIGYEPNKLYHIQALLLITWWWDKKDDGGQNMRSCAVNALNIAQSIGMNRWAQYPKSDPILRGLWKRVWWGCMIRDCLSAVAHGLPLMLDLSQCDIPPLTPDDFIEDSGQRPDQQNHPYLVEEMQFYIQEITLCILLGTIFTRQYSYYRLQSRTKGSASNRELATSNSNQDFGEGGLKGDTLNDECDRQLRDWFLNIPSELYYDFDDVHSHRFLPAYIHLMFFITLCIRYRERSVSQALTPKAIAEKQYCQIRGFAAASIITKIVKNLKVHGQVMKCTGFLSHGMFHCMLYHMVEGQSTDHAIVRDAHEKYQLCLNALYDFSQLWISASLIHRLFEALQSTMNIFVPNKRLPATVASGPLPQYPNRSHISSSVSTRDINTLLATPFSFEGRNVVPEGSDSSITESLQLISPFFSDMFPTDAFSEAVQFPMSLDIDEWCNFYNLELNIHYPEVLTK